MRTLAENELPVDTWGSKAVIVESKPSNKSKTCLRKIEVAVKRTKRDSAIAHIMSDVEANVVSLKRNVARTFCMTEIA